MELKLKHTCKYCNEEFATGALLGNHISKQCLKNPNRGIQKNSKIWKCSICNCDFSSRRILQEHRKIEHESEFKGFYGYHPKIDALVIRVLNRWNLRSCMYAKVIFGISIENIVVDDKFNSIYINHLSVKKRLHLKDAAIIPFFCF